MEQAPRTTLTSGPKSGVHFTHGKLEISNRSIARGELPLIDRLYSICRTGTWTQTLKVSFTLNLEQDPRKWQRLSRSAKGPPVITVHGEAPDAGSIKILNVTVPLGPVKMAHELHDVADEAVAGIQSGKKSIRVVREDVVVTETYPNWIPASPGRDLKPADSPKHKSPRARRESATAPTAKNPRSKKRRS